MSRLGSELHTAVNGFFTQYAKALLARDAKAIARLYAIPSLIVFPGNSIVVSDPGQTESFLASSWGQYEGIHEIDQQVSVLAEAPAGVWADVTWSYSRRPQERFCYQLVPADEGYQIAVLTPLEIAP